MAMEMEMLIFGSQFPRHCDIDIIMSVRLIPSELISEQVF